MLFGILVDLFLAFYASTYIINGRADSQQFNCRSMHTIQLKDMLGQGNYKNVYLGVYDNNTKVVVEIPK